MHPNDFGKYLFSISEQVNLEILNGCLPGDEEGNHTFIAHNGSSVIDYLSAFMMFYSLGITSSCFLGESHCLLILQKRSRPIYVSENNIYAMAFKHCTTVDRGITYKIMLTFISMTLMQGQSGAAEKMSSFALFRQLSEE